jgi:hypothetical protein
MLTSVACVVGPQEWTHHPTISPSKTSKNQFKKFSWISNDKNYSKFNISHILGLKITKPPPWNPTHQALLIECAPYIF